MGQSISQKRPWLAALLGALATGLGHLYLRRWKRALGWLAVLFGAGALFVDPAALQALWNSATVDYWEVAPLLVVGSLSVVDAYLIARAQNEFARRAATPAGERTHCPNCGKELDADLAFCHWCTTELAPVDDGQEGNAATPDDA